MENSFRFSPTVGRNITKNRFKIIGTNTMIKYIVTSYPYSVYYVFIPIHKYRKRIFESYPKYV